MLIQEAIQRLRERARVPRFAATIWDPELDAALRAATPEQLFSGREIRDPSMASCALAGLYLWNDNFSASHNLCQAIHTPTGSYWHGLCHRREGHLGAGVTSNLGNARHWFRQVGDHPAFEAVYRMALDVLDNARTGCRWASEAAPTLRERREWDPFALIDWFGMAEAGTLSPQSQALLEEIQRREIHLLVDWSLQNAEGLRKDEG